jgi:hypothetical protein
LSLTLPFRNHVSVLIVIAADGISIPGSIFRVPSSGFRVGGFHLPGPRFYPCAGFRSNVPNSGFHVPNSGLKFFMSFFTPFRSTAKVQAGKD